MTSATDVFDTIYCDDSRHMGAIEDGAAQLVVTSPPYNVDKDYDTHDDNRLFHEYLKLLDAVWCECYRVLCPGGRIAINIANTNRRPYLPLNSYITQQMIHLVSSCGVRSSGTKEPV